MYTLQEQFAHLLFGLPTFFFQIVFRGQLELRVYVGPILATYYPSSVYCTYVCIYFRSVYLQFNSNLHLRSLICDCLFKKYSISFSDYSVVRSVISFSCHSYLISTASTHRTILLAFYLLPFLSRLLLHQSTSPPSSSMRQASVLQILSSIRDINSLKPTLNGE